MLVKYNIDCNATSSASVQHFHGTSMTASFFGKKFGDEILCTTDFEFKSNLTDTRQKKYFEYQNHIPFQC